MYKRKRDPNVPLLKEKITHRRLITVCSFTVPGANIKAFDA